jgi:hypothetical protein
MDDKEIQQRVKALEYDIKLTKDDIQRMLLDIQEQLLVHRFPTLRKNLLLLPKGSFNLYKKLEEKRELSRSAQKKNIA